jgi:hypothetical protein
MGFTPRNGPEMCGQRSCLVPAERLSHDAIIGQGSGRESVARLTYRDRVFYRARNQLRPAALA